MINCSFWLYRKTIIFLVNHGGKITHSFDICKRLSEKNFDDSLKYFQMGKIVAKKNDQKNYHLPQRLHPLSLPLSSRCPFIVSFTPARFACSPTSGSPSSRRSFRRPTSGCPPRCWGICRPTSGCPPSRWSICRPTNGCPPSW